MMKKLSIAALLVFLGILTLQTPGYAQAATGCVNGPLTWTPINKSTSGVAKIVTGAAGKNIYVCKVFLWSPAQSVALIEGSGTNCGTSPLGLLGGNAAATGQVFGTNSGFVLPADAIAWARTTVTGNDVCVALGSSVQVSGVIVTTTQ